MITSAHTTDTSTMHDVASGEQAQTSGLFPDSVALKSGACIFVARSESMVKTAQSRIQFDAFTIHPFPCIHGEILLGLAYL